MAGERSSEGSSAPGHSAEGRRHQALQGEDRRRVLAEAFDYRGDVRIHLADGSALEGYLFANEDGGDAPHVRVFPTGRDEKVMILHRDIVGLDFSGDDKAFGTAWQSWSARREKVRKAAGAASEGKGAGSGAVRDR